MLCSMTKNNYLREHQTFTSSASNVVQSKLSQISYHIQVHRLGFTITSVHFLGAVPLSFSPEGFVRSNNLQPSIFCKAVVA